MQLFEKYGTLIERNTALIEKVSPCRPVYIAFLPRRTAAIASLGAIVRPAEGAAALTKDFAIEVRLAIRASTAMQATVTVGGDWVGATNATVSVSLAVGTNQLSVDLSAQDVELWWPAGAGPQTLYSIAATVGLSTMRRRVGFRTSRLQTDQGAARPGERSGSGEGCYFLVFVQLFEKYGTSIERYTALIEKVSAFIGNSSMVILVNGQVFIIPYVYIHNMLRTYL
eukprot:SAG31_NODE_948_length_10825_cov_9.412829_16_plen_226_part_00